MKKSTEETLYGKIYSLLEKWTEYELGVLSPRSPSGLFTITYAWKWSPKLKAFTRIKEGACLERSTSPKEVSRIEEFGYAFRTLTIQEQSILIVEHFLGAEEWKKVRKSYKISKEQLTSVLRTALMKLVTECLRRQIVIF